MTAGIMRLNPTLGMDICPCPVMLCCSVCNQSYWKNGQTEKREKENKEKIKKLVTYILMVRVTWVQFPSRLLLSPVFNQATSRLQDMVLD
jgi:hypothetical protein